MITVFAKRPFLCAQIYLISPRISYVRLKRSSLFFNQAKHLNFDNAWAAYNKVRNQVTSALHTAKKKLFTQERLVSIYYKQRWLESSTLLNPRMKKLAFSDVGAAEKASRHITSESETESESSQILYLLMKNHSSFRNSQLCRGLFEVLLTHAKLAREAGKYQVSGQGEPTCRIIRVSRKQSKYLF